MPILRGGASDFTATVKAGAETNAAVSAASSVAAGGSAPKKSSSGGGVRVSAGAGAVITQSAVSKSSGLQPFFARMTFKTSTPPKIYDEFCIGLYRWWGATPKLVYSKDGMIWEEKTNNVAITSSPRALAWNGKYWLLVADSGSSLNCIIRSTDGYTWTAVTQTLLTSAYDACWTGSMWVVVGTGTSHTIITSPDGITWTGQGNAVNVAQQTGVGNCMGVASDGKMTIVCGQIKLAVHTEATGWVIKDMTGLGLGSHWTHITTNGKKWIAIGRELPNAMISSNGTTWTTLPSFLRFSNMGPIRWMNGIIIATGYMYDDTAAYKISRDEGLTWTGTPFSAAGGVKATFDVCWNGKKYVAIGAGANALSTFTHSSDGTNWSGTRPISWDGFTGITVVSRNIVHGMN